VSNLALSAITTDERTTLRTAQFTNADRRNAVDLATVSALHEALLSHPEDVLVLGSSTPGVFCAGADLSVPDEERAALSDVLYECYHAMVTRAAPVIAVVDGAAVGGGAQLSTAADLRVAGPAARWRWVGPGHGLAVGAWVVPTLVGRSRGLDLVLTGRWLELEEAVASGLVHRVSEDAWSEAMALARQLSSADPAALARVKQVAGQAHLVDALRAEQRQNHDAWDGSAPHVSRAHRAANT
jgi:enoyl-CoA hydratase